MSSMANREIADPALAVSGPLRELCLGVEQVDPKPNKEAIDYGAYLAGWHPGSTLWQAWPSRMGTNTHVDPYAEWHPSHAPQSPMSAGCVRAVR